MVIQASEGIVTAARFQQQFEQFGGNARAAAGTFIVIVGIFAFAIGFLRALQYAKQDAGERQQKKYSVLGVIALFIIGLVAITGGMWTIMTGKDTGLDLTTQDVIGDNGYGTTSHCGSGPC